jgi:thymidylate synthase ThyX
MNKIVVKEPEVTLRWGTPNAYNECVGKALICYDGNIVDYRKKSDAYLRAVGDSCYKAKHHTIFQHATFSFNITNISRQCVWEILHSHPNYNTSQASQRYVRLDKISATIPPFKNSKNKQLFEKAIVEAWQRYNELSRILSQDVTKYFCEIFHKKQEELTDKDLSIIEKKTIEIARYVIPVAAHTTLAYTINGLTLHRLHRLMKQGDCGWEAEKVILKMVDEVKKHDMNFFCRNRESKRKKDTLESRVIHEMRNAGCKTNEKALREFDAELAGLYSRLVSYDEHAERVVADSIRMVLGFSSTDLSDEDAIDYVLNPKKNPYYAEILNLSMMSPLMRSLFNTSYTFKKRLSHTADSQNQRHRTSFASRPILTLHDTEKPDYITPKLIRENQKANELYREWMEKIWDIKNQLLNNKAKKEYATYLLPNARAIRYQESSPLLYLAHKFNNRSCLNAQEEIWSITMQEIMQIKEVHPIIGRYLGQPTCLNRYQVKKKPFCLEGKRFCGIKAWEQFPDIKRKL